MAPGSSLTRRSFCQLRARLDSVCLHLSSRCGNLFWRKAELSKRLLLANLSLSLVVYLTAQGRCCAGSRRAADPVGSSDCYKHMCCDGNMASKCVFNNNNVNSTQWWDGTTNLRGWKLQTYKISAVHFAALGWSAYRKNSLYTQAKATVPISANLLLIHSEKNLSRHYKCWVRLATLMLILKE